MKKVSQKRQREKSHSEKYCYKEVCHPILIFTWSMAGTEYIIIFSNLYDYLILCPILSYEVSYSKSKCVILIHNIAMHREHPFHNKG